MRIRLRIIKILKPHKLKLLFLLILILVNSDTFIGQAADQKPSSDNKAESSTSALVSSSYLFVWAGDADQLHSDFLAVLDIRPDANRYGRIVTTLPVGVKGTNAHHTEHQMPEGNILWANGFNAGQTFMFDLNSPETPKLNGSFETAGEFKHPHSFVRLPNGKVLATFQIKGEGHDEMEPGGLVELDSQGNMIRSSSAQTSPENPTIRPYSLAVVPKLDRVVTTSFDMHGSVTGNVVQVWRLSDLKLLKTLKLPPGRFDDQAQDSYEPRLLSNGETVLVTTFRCGLYQIKGLDGTDPSVKFVYSFATEAGTICALPLVTGHFWIQAVTSLQSIISFDISDPSKPKEVSRLKLGESEGAHWIALEPQGERIVITGYGALSNRILMAKIDKSTGQLSLDTAFREDSTRLGITLKTESTGLALPHGTVFSNP